MSRRKAEQRAAQLLAEEGIVRPPVEPDVLAKARGAEVVYEHFDPDTGISGVLVREDDHVVIGVNGGHVVERQRFTIAHELGHLLLHPGVPVIVEKHVRVNYRDAVSSMATSRQEIEANQFAAALLMPEPWVDAAAKHAVDRSGGHLGEKELVRELAAEFRVSSQAMGYRLINMGILASIDWSTD